MDMRISVTIKLIIKISNLFTEYAFIVLIENMFILNHFIEIYD